LKYVHLLKIQSVPVPYSGLVDVSKHKQLIVYSCLMGEQAIDQIIFHEVLGKTKVLYCKRETIVWSIACTHIK